MAELKERITSMIGYIITAIMLFAAAWIISKIPCCKGKRGTLDISKLLGTGSKPVKKRKQRIGNTVFHVKSVFTGQRVFADAIKSIIMRKMESGRLTRENITE